MPLKPDALPLLEALAWQCGGIEHLEPEDQLRLYERNWRFRGVLAEPSSDELQYIRALAEYFHSDLALAI
ncbi:hypothetical protein GKIL_2001 [Gloeobacter kilaueensis JS1]|uniref:Uncharacterized protein n=2 Tax=Gloeobacter TaxID=33071 RepID=U5QGZ4_GLOK1|nr:hypothetical protein GKIL_2001 [Gloeobacter kilaueensis JS1]